MCQSSVDSTDSGETVTFNRRKEIALHVVFGLGMATGKRVEKKRRLDGIDKWLTRCPGNVENDYFSLKF